MKTLPSKFTNQAFNDSLYLSVLLLVSLVLNYHCWILDMLNVKIMFIIVSIFFNVILLNLFGGVMS